MDFREVIEKFKAENRQEINEQILSVFYAKDVPCLEVKDDSFFELTAKLLEGDD